MTKYKKDIVRLVHQKLNGKQTIKSIEATLDTILETVLIEAMKENKVELRGFGTFKRVTKKGVSPLAGEYEKDSISFKLSRRVRENINNG